MVKRSAEEGVSSASPTTENPPVKNTNKRRRKKKSKKKNHVKDPKEAHEYLSSWKNKDTAPGVWKFNKNTQSWLIRKMYNAEMIPKASFAILMDYLTGLHGKETIDRINEDTVKRILRYKEWEKKGESGDKNEENDEGETEDKTLDEADGDDDEEEENDDKRFRKMSAHDKRKEYKRARKVHDVVKKLIEETKSDE